MNTNEVLIKARALIADPSRWTQRSFAVHKNGNPIGPSEANACQWCALGALHRITGDTHTRYNRAADALYEAARKIDLHGSLVQVNDHLGHDATLRMFDLAIEATRA